MMRGKRSVGMIRSVAPGQRVLLVIPTSFSKTPTWLNLVRRDSKVWLHYLGHDRQLRLIKTAAPYQYSANVAVRGYLYVVRGR